MTAHFLIVEDHPTLAQVLANAVRCVGDVHVASSVEQGIGLFHARRDWAAFVIDVRLPDGNGLDVLAHAREAGCVAPALVLTAVHDAETINRIFELEARYLVKPADPDNILSFFSEAARPQEADRSMRDWGERYRLTETEMAILRSAVEGSERDRLAVERGISTTTLNKHVNNLLRKTGDASLLAAAARLLRERD